MTIKEAVEFGTKILLESQIEEAKIDAWLLFEFVTKISRTEYFLYPDKQIDEAAINKYRQLIEKRAEHYPVQYLTNVQQFMGYDFYVNEAVLVPRPETELLVVEVENLLKAGFSCHNENSTVKLTDKSEENINQSEIINVLDMCTGSGCIAISLKLRNSNYQISAVDISKEALKVAQKNAKNLNSDVTFYNSDLFKDVPENKYDLIVSNPPYIETKELDNLMTEVKDYEPMLALDGMDDGLYFYKRIIENSVKYLKPNGKIIFEIGYNQADDVVNLLENAGFTDIKVIKDMSGLDRIVSGGI